MMNLTSSLSGDYFTLHQITLFIANWGPIKRNMIQAKARQWGSPIVTVSTDDFVIGHLNNALLALFSSHQTPSASRGQSVRVPVIEIATLHNSCRCDDRGQGSPFTVVQLDLIVLSV